MSEDQPTRPKPPATESAIENAREALAQAAFKKGRAQSAAIISTGKAKQDLRSLEEATKAHQDAEDLLQDLVNRFMAPASIDVALKAVRDVLGGDPAKGGKADGGPVSPGRQFLVGEQGSERILPRAPAPATIAHKVADIAVPPVKTTGPHAPLFPEEGERWLDNSWKPPVLKERRGKQWVAIDARTDQTVTIGVDLATKPDLHTEATVDVLGKARPLGPDGPELTILADRPVLTEGPPLAPASDQVEHPGGPLEADNQRAPQERQEGGPKHRFGSILKRGEG